MRYYCKFANWDAKISSVKIKVSIEGHFLLKMLSSLEEEEACNCSTYNQEILCTNATSRYKRYELDFLVENKFFRGTAIKEKLLQKIQKLK